MEAKKNPDKDVHRYSNHFFLFGLILSITVVITAFEWRTEKVLSNPRPPESPLSTIEFYPVPVPIHEKTPDPPPLKEVIVVNPDRIVEGENTVTPDPDIQIESPTVDITIDIKEIVLPPETKVDTFIVVERMPVPIGGLAGFYKQLGKSLNYPDRAKRFQAEGKVIVEFVVDQLGNPINVKVIKGIGYGCDEEAMRVLSKAKWEPGKQRGKPVPVKMTLPIYFRLN